MEIKLDYKKTPVKINNLMFKDSGVVIELATGETDLYSYKWLIRHIAKIRPHVPKVKNNR